MLVRAASMDEAEQFSGSRYRHILIFRAFMGTRVPHPHFSPAI
jgi:hypothetical protein